MLGTLTVILGGMYSGKSETLLSLVRRADLGRRRFSLIKPAIDDRYSISEVVTHDGRRYACTSVESSRDIHNNIPDDLERLFIDEAQFFDAGLVPVLDDLVRRGVQVVAAGLDLDFRGNPFDTMIPLVFSAKRIVKLEAICDVCGEDASRSQRVVDGRAVTTGDVVQVGGSETYEPRCRLCFESDPIVYPDLEPTNKTANV